MSTKTLTRNNMNISGVLTPLISFDCIFDTDYGLMKLIRTEYFDTDIFSENFFTENDKIVNMISALYSRDVHNPVLLPLKEKSIDVAQSLYDEFISKRYKEILDYSMSTEIYNLIEVYLLSGEIRPTIVYKTKEELEILNSHIVTAKVNKVSLDEVLKSDISIYQQFFFKDIDNTYINSLAEKIYSSSVYIGNYTYCSDKDEQIIINRNVGLLNLNRNTIFKIDIYNKNKLKRS